MLILKISIKKAILAIRSMLMNPLYQIGEYFSMLSNVFSKPEKFKLYWSRITFEAVNIGVNSLAIVAIISLFMGMVITIQTATLAESPLLPVYTIGFTARESMIKEFSPTVISLILAGKVGSSIASELGTMRVTEQIDALEIMGVNSRGYLILPKIISSLVMFPILVVISMFLGIGGGFLIAQTTNLLTTEVFKIGLLYYFNDYAIVYALVKTVCFAFIITSVSAYYGYYTKGGSVEVGKSSTKAVVYSSILILLVNVLITQLMLIK